MTEIATFPAWLRESLRCPVTGAPLEPAQRPDGTEVLVAAGHPEHEYEVVDGVPVLLAPGPAAP